MPAGARFGASRPAQRQPIFDLLQILDDFLATSFPIIRRLRCLAIETYLSWVIMVKWAISPIRECCLPTEASSIRRTCTEEADAMKANAEIIPSVPSRHWSCGAISPLLR